MTALLSHIDPDGLLEYSVVYTDRALNHMSARFQTAMRDISGLLKQVYHADAVAIVPGSAFFVDEHAPCQSVRLNFSTPTKEQIVKGVSIMAGVLKEMEA